MNRPEFSGNAAGSLPVPQALVILLLGLILTLPSWFLRDLWNPDEPRYAEVSREMVVLNDYLVPHLNGEIYAEKPPLFFWLSAFFQAFGFGVRAGRIVTAFATLGTLFLTWALARLWFPFPTPLLSVLILATAFQFLWLGRVGVLDVPLGFLTLMAVYGFCRFRRDGGWWAVLFYGGMGLATLTKGPVGILIICLGAISVAIFTEAPRRGRGMHILWGAPLTAAIICAWLIPASIQGGPEYRNFILFQQNIGRMVSSWSHARPWYYYFTTLPVHFFPWILFVPWALVWLWRKGKSYCGGGGRFLILWFCLGFLAFTIISGKRGRYLIPILPALAICVAVLFDAVACSAAASKLRVWGRRLLLFQNGFFLPLGFLPIFLAILFLIRGSNIASFGGADDPEIAGVIRGALAWPSNAGFLLLGASMLAVALIGIRFAARNRIIPAFLSIVGAMIVFSVGIDFVLAPRLDRVKSAREISRRADEMVPPEGGGRVSLYPNVYSGALNVYSRRIRMPVLTTPAEVDRFLSAPGKGIIITSRKYLQQDSAKFLAPYVVIDVKRLGSRRMVFLTKPPSLSPE